VGGENPNINDLQHLDPSPPHEELPPTWREVHGLEEGRCLTLPGERLRPSTSTISGPLVTRSTVDSARLKRCAVLLRYEFVPSIDEPTNDVDIVLHDESPLLVRKNRLHLSDVRPRRAPSTQRARDVDGQSVSHGTLPTPDQVRRLPPCVHGCPGTRPGRGQRERCRAARGCGPRRDP
jgi:hypothetical protein